MSEKIVLSARMQAVADMVTPGNPVVDVGCDHGYVSIYLVQNGVAPKVLAMDVNCGPLERASEHIRRAGLADYIELRLSDGLWKYQSGEGKTLILAGMGGPLMQRILEREPEKTASFEELILQPQSELASFRRFLREAGYLTTAEDMIWEEGKFYPVMKVVPVSESVDGTELEDCFGPLLLKEKHPVLAQFLTREWSKLAELRERLERTKDSNKAAARLAELEKETELLRQAFKRCGMEELHDGRDGNLND